MGPRKRSNEVRRKYSVLYKRKAAKWRTNSGKWTDFFLCKTLTRAGSDPKARYRENIWFWLQWAGK